MLILTIQNEYSYHQQYQFNLKDMYAHDLANILQMIYSTIEVINSSPQDLPKNKQLMELIIKKCEEGSYLINEIRKEN